MLASKNSAQAQTCNDTLHAQITDATEQEAAAAAALVRAQRHTDLLMAMLAVEAKARIPAELKHVTVAEYAASRSISKATVLRYRNEGMPVFYVGTAMRIDPVAADEWRCQRGRKPTTPAPHLTVVKDNLDVSSALAGAGLRTKGAR